MTLKLANDEKYLLQQLEEALWREETRYDAEFLEKVLAADFFEFGRSGRTYTREDILSDTSQPIDAVLPLPDFQVRLLTPDVALVTYNSARTFEGVVEYGRRASIWSRTEGGWVLRFHQGTPYQPTD